MTVRDRKLFLLLVVVFCLLFLAMSLRLLLFVVNLCSFASGASLSAVSSGGFLVSVAGIVQIIIRR